MKKPTCKIFEDGVIVRDHNVKQTLCKDEKGDGITIVFDKYTKNGGRTSYWKYERGILRTVIGISREGAENLHYALGQYLKNVKLENNDKDTMEQ